MGLHHDPVKPVGDLLVGFDLPQASALLIFQPRVLELPDLVELGECVKLALEVGRVELVKILVAEDAVLLQFLLEELPDLLGVEILDLQEVRGGMSCLLNVDLLVLDDFDTGAEEAILTRLSNDLLLERDLERLGN